MDGAIPSCQWLLWGFGVESLEDSLKSSSLVRGCPSCPPYPAHDQWRTSCLTKKLLPLSRAVFVFGPPLSDVMNPFVLTLCPKGCEIAGTRPVRDQLAHLAAIVPILKQDLEAELNVTSPSSQTLLLVLGPPGSRVRLCNFRT
jgi:hypothetical protein